MLSSRFVRVYLMPGAVFQSVIVGGGYGTGREIVEYFTSFGPWGGLLGMIITLLAFWLVLSATYEFARRHQAYDYRTFFKKLLGPAWWSFEILYVLLTVLVLAVVASAAGEILDQQFQIPYAAGIAVMLAIIGILIFFGRDLIARALTVWTGVLYGVFILYAVMAFSGEGANIAEAFSTHGVESGWALKGFQYALYNVAIAPAILFAARGIETKKEAIWSGFASALIATVPAVLFHITFAAGYPAILEEEIPLYWMIGQLGAAFLVFLYVAVLFGTFIETGAGYIQGINERIDGVLAERGGGTLSPIWRTTIAVAGILASAGLASVGIVNLIAQGYGMIAWGFGLVYVLPILVWLVLKGRKG